MAENGFWRNTEASPNDSSSFAYYKKYETEKACMDDYTGRGYKSPRCEFMPASATGTGNPVTSAPNGGGVVPIPDTPIWDETACARYGEGGKLNPPCTDWGGETIPGWTQEKWGTCQKKCTKKPPAIKPVVVGILAFLALIAAVVYFVFMRKK